MCHDFFFGLMPAGSVADIAWTDVRVGDFILVKDDELFPADMACIYSALPDKVSFASALLSILLDSYLCSVPLS